MKEEDLWVSFAGFEKVWIVGNAGGTCRKKKEAQELADCPSVGLIAVGSFTEGERMGNPGQVYWTNDKYSINCNGLPGPGADKCRELIPEMVKIAHDAQPIPKLLIVSIVGFSSQEYANLARLALDSGADGVKLNLGCPNVWQEGRQKTIPCFDFGLTYEILNAVEKEVGPGANILVKLSPCCDDE